jgi:hypothetical protein
MTMIEVLDTDRKAAEELRAALADLSGFWFAPTDTGPLCTALAQHRQRPELQSLARMAQSPLRSGPAERSALGDHQPQAFDSRMRRPRVSAAGR